MFEIIKVITSSFSHFLDREVAGPFSSSRADILVVAAIVARDFFSNLKLPN